MPAIRLRKFARHAVIPLTNCGLESEKARIIFIYIFKGETHDLDAFYLNVKYVSQRKLPSCTAFPIN